MFNRPRSGAALAGLVHRSDMGSQCLSIRYSQRLADNGVVASVGSKGDSYDNSMIESFNGHYRRRHGEILPGRRHFTTPAAHEAAHYR